ncbi:MAG: cysteine desulfurase [Blastocatellia bacterium]|jgi:cysteine desulfurase|nr:cysteine desulfurase [Blastocatellia bacterium]
MKKRIYLDNHSTTPVDPRVLDAMLPFFSESFGNAASSGHLFGWEAADAVEVARKQTASLMGAKPEEIVFTSGATESDNLALKGIAEALRAKGNHIITTTIEHRAVLDSCRILEQQGFEVDYLPVDERGLVNPDDVRKRIRKETVLISIMHSNNEIGVVQDLAEIGKMSREHAVIFHTDAAQSAGKIHFDVESLGVDLASFSAHKMYGPKGIGALYVRSANPRIELTPIMSGGGQERGLRSGTLNVPAIVGFGAACAIALEQEAEEGDRILKLRERLRTGLSDELEGVFANGDLEQRLPGNLNLSFSDIRASELMSAINDEIAVSSGSACSSESGRSSHVLRAIGLPDDLADSSIRFGVGRFNQASDIEYAIERFTEVIGQLRGRPKHSHADLH